MQNLKLVKDVLARDVELGPIKGVGPLGNFSTGEAPNLFERIISGIIGIMTVVAGIWFIFNFLIAGIEWLSSGGDKNKLASAQGKITQSVVGLVIIIAAIFFIQLIGTLLGLPNILKPANFIKNFWQ
jgi:hypothetical protein